MKRSDPSPTQGKSADTAAPKRNYEPPRLSRLGAIASLTAGGGQAKGPDTGKNSN